MTTTYHATQTRVAIRDLPAGERPQERLLRHGPATLSSAELLALVLGLPELAQAESLLAGYGGMGELARAPLTELIDHQRGLGPRRAVRLKAALELSRRALTAAPLERIRLHTPADAATLALDEMGALEQEELRAILLDTRLGVLKFHTVYVGAVNRATVRIAEIFREAVRLNATYLIVLHNHPSGDPSPSDEDVQVTRQVREAGRLLNIDLLDHLVIGGHGRWLSLKERGLGF